MGKKQEPDGVFRKPERGLISKTRSVVGTLCILLVMVCFVIRIFVGRDTNDIPAANSGETVETPDYTFRNEDARKEHYEKHGDEFGYQDAAEYEAGANRVIQSDEALHKEEAEDGDDVYYLEATNEFVIVSTDGYIRTYFKPEDGIAYYNRQ